MIHFGRCRTDVHKDVMPPAGHKGTFDGRTAVESAFALLLTKVTKPPYPAQISYNCHDWRK